MIDGELVEPPEGGYTEDIALRAIHEQEVEVEVQAELVEAPEEQEVASIQIVQDITDHK